MEDLTGKQFGAYRIVGQIGQGGMAAVFKAYQASMDRHVALKVLPRQLASDPQFIGRFENEARMLARLQHPHILPVHDFGHDLGYTYFVMPLVETGSLSDQLSGRPLPVERICEVLMQVGSALDYAHSRGLLHRDIKPSNVLVDESGNCLLTDFGIAKIVEGSTDNFTATGTIMGTPTYMSPEQGRGETLDRRSDIYSLGIIGYELAAGRVPFTADTPVAVIFKHVNDPLPPLEKLNPGLPPALVRIIYTALSKDRDKRFQTARDMVQAISAVAAETRAARKDAATVVEPLPPMPTQARPAAPQPTAGPAAAAPGTIAVPTRVAGGALLGVGGLALVGLVAAVLLCGAIFIVPQMMDAVGNAGAGTATQALSSVHLTGTARAGQFGQAATLAPENETNTPRPPTRTPQPAASATPRPAEATPTALAGAIVDESAAAAVVFGPQDGSLPHVADGFIEAYAAGVNLADFSTTVTFLTPNKPSWDMGFLFRHSGTNNQMRLVIESNGEWSLRNQVDDRTETIQDGVLTNLNVSEGAPNKVTLVAVGARGFFFLNDALVSDLTLQARQTAGEIYVATELITSNEAASGSTDFTGFTVWGNVGPVRGGGLDHEDDAFIEFASNGAQLRDFVVTARTTNPYEGDWDVGFLFRSLELNTELRLIVASDSTWYLYNRFDGSSTLGAEGTVANLNVSDGGVNELLLLAHGRLGRLYLNSVLVAEMDLSAILEPGEISLATGIFTGYKQPGAVTRYSNFSVFVAP